MQVDGPDLPLCFSHLDSQLPLVIIYLKNFLWSLLFVISTLCEEISFFMMQVDGPDLPLCFWHLDSQLPMHKQRAVIDRVESGLVDCEQACLKYCILCTINHVAGIRPDNK